MRYLIIMAVFTLALSSCRDYKKEEDGLEYYIISNGKGDLITDGDIIQFHASQYYRTGKVDSLLNPERAGISVFDAIDSNVIPRNYYRVFKQMRAGDSVIMRTLSDTLMLRGATSLPPFVKKGHYLLSKVKIVAVYKDKAAADSALKVERDLFMKKQMEGDKTQRDAEDKIINDYLNKYKITAQKTENGVYVQVIKPGIGALLDTSMIATIDYTGRLLENGKPFDSSTDTTINSHGGKPIKVVLNDDARFGISVIPGWREGLLALNKGAEAKLIVPSFMAYGQQGRLPQIPANAILIFDIKVIDAEPKETVRERLENEFRGKLENKDSLEKFKKMLESKLGKDAKVEITTPSH